MTWSNKYKSPSIDRVIYTIITLFFLYFSLFSIIDHLALRSNMNDLGGIDQALHQTLQGNFMRNSSFFVAEGVTNPSLLAKHSHYSLIILLPLYALYQDPIILLVIQAFLISLGTLPLYWLGKKYFTNKPYLALVIPIVYLLNPAIHDGVLYDFHPIVAISPIILFAYYALVTKRKVWFYLLSILIALTKEDAPLIIAMFGVYMMITQKRKLEGALLAVISLLFFYVNFKYLMPYFSGVEVNPLVQSRFAHIGGSVDAGILTMLTNPLQTAITILTPLKISYLIVLLIPFAFLPVLCPFVSLLALPNLGINLLSSVLPMHYPFEYYYHVPIVTVFSLASLVALKKIYDSKPNLVNLISLATIGLSLLITLLVSPLPISATSTFSEFSVSDHAKRIDEILSIVPTIASISIQNNLGPHFSKRSTIYTYPYKSHETDFVVLDVHDPNPRITSFRTTRNFMFNTQMNPQNYYDSIVSLLRDTNYRVVYSDDGYVVFEKSPSHKSQEDVLEYINNNATLLFERYEVQLTLTSEL